MKPRASIPVGLVRIVEGEEDTVRTDLMNIVLQCGAGEVARSRDPNILLEVFMDGLLASLVQSQRLFDVLKPMIDTPEIKRNVLTQMPNDDLHFGEAIKDTVGHKAEQMQTDVICERERGSDEVPALCILQVIENSLRCRRVKVDRHIKLLYDSPEVVVLRLIVEKYGLLAFASGSKLPVVEQSAMEPIFLHAPTKFRCRLLRAMH